LITITAGGSAGPEASVMVMGAALMHLLNRLLAQPLRERRIITLCGMSAALSAFFGEKKSLFFVFCVFISFVLERNASYGSDLCAGGAASQRDRVFRSYFSLCGCFCRLVHDQQAYLGKISWRKGTKRKKTKKKHIVNVLVICQFQYIPIVEPLNFVDMAWSVVLGVMAGLTALAFIGLMRFGKWMSHKTTLDKYPFLSSLIGGALVGVSGLVAPSSLFWSENELQVVM
jgi:hypothetical protein